MSRDAAGLDGGGGTNLLRCPELGKGKAEGAQQTGSLHAAGGCTAPSSKELIKAAFRKAEPKAAFA